MSKKRDEKKIKRKLNGDDKKGRKEKMGRED